MTIAELWPFIDTMLKVCLGSAIAFASIWLYSKYYPSYDVTSQNNRRLERLESVSIAVGNVNHCFAKYSALVIESTRFGNNWPAARREELERVNKDLVSEFKKMADAEAHLLMLGEKTMEKTLRIYGAKIAQFRKQVYIGRKDITDQEIADLKQDILTLREHFYDLLSKKYDRLLA